MKSFNHSSGFTNGLQLILCAVIALWTWATHAQTNGPQLVDPKLAVRTVVTNLNQPIGLAFLKENDFLVLEKASGQIKRFRKGEFVGTVLDLPVNSSSERGLLSIALHPRFPDNPGVYLYWTESSTGMDSTDLAAVPLLGNRVDRFRWNGSTLTFEKNIIRLRSFQMDEGQPLRGNHNGGVIRFGLDRKLYIVIGDNGRRGQMQNLPDGPGPAGNLPDDQFGGPEPDDAHLTGVILRLNDDGSTPRDNPFFRAGALRGGEAGENLQKVFAYGVRNEFGLAFDPFSGNLWDAQNGDDSFTEINLIDPGANLGWVQVMGPLSRIAQFKAIETSSNFFGLQQIRWSPTNIADTAEEALERMFWVFEDGKEFGAQLLGREEVPRVETDASAVAMFALNRRGELLYELRATGPIENVTQAHIHLGGPIQNGPVVAFLFESLMSPTNFQAGDLIAAGTITDSDIIGRPRFTPNLANLLDRMRQGRTYANLHTTAFPAGQIRGQIRVADRDPVSFYSDPEFSWKFEVAPGGLGFISSKDLGKRYRGDMIVGAARDFLQGGPLFRFELKTSKKDEFKGGLKNDDDNDIDRDERRVLKFEDPRLADKVADNTNKYDITESESLLFGTGFGISTDIQTGPNGNLFVVSLSHGAIYEILKAKDARKNDDDDDD